MNISLKGKVKTIMRVKKGHHIMYQDLWKEMINKKKRSRAVLNKTNQTQLITLEVNWIELKKNKGQKEFKGMIIEVFSQQVRTDLTIRGI